MVAGVGLKAGSPVGEAAPAFDGHGLHIAPHNTVFIYSTSGAFHTQAAIAFYSIAAESAPFKKPTQYSKGGGGPGVEGREGAHAFGCRDAAAGALR